MSRDWECLAPAIQKSVNYGDSSLNALNSSTPLEKP